MFHVSVSCLLTVFSTTSQQLFQKVVLYMDFYNKNLQFLQKIDNTRKKKLGAKSCTFVNFVTFLTAKII